MESETILLKKFIKNPNIILRKKEGIFVGKTKESILVGPVVNENFDFQFFQKRIVSSCIYSRKTYKRISKSAAIKYIEKNNFDKENLKDVVLEVLKNGDIIKHNLLFMKK